LDNLLGEGEFWRQMNNNVHAKTLTPELL